MLAVPGAPVRRRVQAIGAGATPFTFQLSARQGVGQSSCNSTIIAAPWDPVFLGEWDSMLAALAAHLKSVGTYDAVTSLRLTGINRTTAELRLPEEILTTPCVTNSLQTWLQATPPYRPSRVLQAWDAITSSFLKSFPDKFFGLEVVPIGTGGNNYWFPKLTTMAASTRPSFRPRVSPLPVSTQARCRTRMRRWCRWPPRGSGATCRYRFRTWI